MDGIVRGSISDLTMKLVNQRSRLVADDPTAVDLDKVIASKLLISGGFKPSR